VGTVDPFDEVADEPGALFSDTFLGARSTESNDFASADLTFERESWDGSVELLQGNEFIVTANVLTPVPIPAAAWLFGSAVLGLTWKARRKRFT